MSPHLDSGLVIQEDSWARAQQPDTLPHSEADKLIVSTLGKPEAAAALC